MYNWLDERRGKEGRQSRSWKSGKALSKFRFLHIRQRVCTDANGLLSARAALHCCFRLAKADIGRKIA